MQPRLMGTRSDALQNMLRDFGSGVNLAAYNTHIGLRSALGAGALFIAGGKQDRLLFPPGSVVTLRGNIVATTYTNGVASQAVTSPVDTTFTTTSAGVTTAVQNVALTGVTCDKTIVNGEEFMTYNVTTPVANTVYASTLDIVNAVANSPIADRLVDAPAATIREGLY